MFLLFCGLSVVSGTGLKLLRFIFTLADCALRNVNATTVAASRHPDHRPLVTPASPSAGFRLVMGVCAPCGLRLTACPADCLPTLRTVFAKCRKFPAVGFAVRSVKRGETPRRKVTDRRNS